MAIRISGTDHLWPAGIVPFEIDDFDYPIGSTDRATIMAAITHWSSSTNITFSPRTSEADYVVFKFGDAETSSDSPVGRRGGMQVVRAANLGVSTANIIHEIGHAIGLQHEQSRHDRDAFVKVDMSNVLDGMGHNFEHCDSDSEDFGPYDYASIMHYRRNSFAKNPFADTITPVSWFGHETQGAGVTTGDITGGGRTDLVLFHIDNPKGENAGFYRVLWDIDPVGNDRRGLSDIKRIPGWFGSETQGAAVALCQLNVFGALDLIVFFVDRVPGGNKGHYRIGWNLDAQGNAARWSDPIEVPGWFGTSTQAAGIATGFIGGSGRPDLVVFHIDDPGGSNSGYYRIGWALNDEGRARVWTPPVPIPDWFGNDNQGGGVALANLDGNAMPSLVVFHVDNPKGQNQGYVRVGRHVDAGGVVTNGWSKPMPVPGWFGSECQGADIAMANLSGAGMRDLIVFHVDNPSGENRGYYRIGFGLTPNGAAPLWSALNPVHNIGLNAITTIGTAGGLSALDIAAVNAMYPVKSAVGPLNRVGGWFGAETAAADVAVADVSGNGMPDLVTLFVDNPAGDNKAYYRIGWNINATGFVTGGYTSAQQIPGWVGTETQGAGVALARIGHGPNLDLIAFHIDNPAGGNAGYYRIGWDLDAAGAVQGGWTLPILVPDWFGSESQDGAIAVADISNSGRPDLVVLHVDNPGGANHAYYRIGWDLDVNTGVAANWTPPIPIPGWFGDETQGAGIAVADLDNNGLLDLIVFSIDNPDGENRGYYHVGRRIDALGNVTGGWSSVVPIAGWFGSENQGGGIAAFDISGDGLQDLVVFHIDSPDGENHGYYRVLFSPPVP